jgi:hypothetical protein
MDIPVQIYQQHHGVELSLTQKAELPIVWHQKKLLVNSPGITETYLFRAVQIVFGRDRKDFTGSSWNRRYGCCRFPQF